MIKSTQSSIRLLLAIVLSGMTLLLHAEEIPLIKEGNIYRVPALINNTMRLHFIIDSGAGVVYIPYTVFKKLRTSGSIRNRDILGEGFSKIANGDLVKTLFINIQKLKIGNTVLTNVKGGVGQNGSAVLLGQSALKQLEPWHIDTRHNILRFGKKTTTHKGYISPSKQIKRGEALTFIYYYIDLHNSGIPSKTASLYAPKVNYLHNGMISRQNVTALKEIYMDQWQQITFTLLRVVSIENEPSHPEKTRVVFHLAYRLFSDMEQRGERGQMELSLILEKSNRSIRIVSQKEKILSRHIY